MEIGIVGFGHLGKSLAKGLIKSNIAVASDIYILIRSSETKDVASKKYGFNIVNNINEMIVNEIIKNAINKAYDKVR